MELFIYGFSFIGILLVFFFIFRGVVLWYFRINEKMELLERNNQMLEKLLTHHTGEQPDALYEPKKRKNIFTEEK